MVRGFRVNQYPLVRVIPGLSATRKLFRNALVVIDGRTLLVVLADALEDLHVAVEK
jgi:hypothetical protein